IFSVLNIDLERDLLIGIDSIPIIEKFSGKSEDFAKVTFKMGFLDKMVKISEKHDFCKKFLIGYLGTLAGLDDDMTLAINRAMVQTLIILAK
ncbi:MAG: hypothetical protein EZS28_040403, partial [Streblomastix strix]